VKTKLYQLWQISEIHSKGIFKSRAVTSFLIIFSSDSAGSLILNILLVIFDVVLVHLKFWFAVIDSVVNLFRAEERDVSGDIVLITGAGHGMGKELALQYSALGSTVVCWDVNEKLNNETVKLLKSKGRKAYGYT
jgi:all-trans-retinol dehydrogenase (NAD+)